MFGNAQPDPEEQHTMHQAAAELRLRALPYFKHWLQPVHSIKHISIHQLTTVTTQTYILS